MRPLSKNIPNRAQTRQGKKSDCMIKIQGEEINDKRPDTQPLVQQQLKR